MELEKRTVRIQVVGMYKNSESISARDMVVRHEKNRRAHRSLLKQKIVWDKWILFAFTLGLRDLLLENNTTSFIAASFIADYEWLNK